MQMKKKVRLVDDSEMTFGWMTGDYGKEAIVEGPGKE